ncbi:hypothetical protein ACFQ0T_09950 [Kitasatospora gansuensis]
MHIRRVRGAEVSAIGVADTSGQLVATVESLVSRPVSSEQLAASQGKLNEILHRVDWQRGELVAASVTVPTLAELLGSDAEVPAVVLHRITAPAAADVPAGVRAAVADALGAVQSWLADERFDGSRLVLVTQQAVVAGESEAIELAQAPVWGLVRSAIEENPGRFALLDLDGSAESDRALPAAAAAGSRRPHCGPDSSWCPDWPGWRSPRGRAGLGLHRHGADHRRDHGSGRAGGPSPGRRTRRQAPAADQPARRGRTRCGRAQH